MNSMCDLPKISENSKDANYEIPVNQTPNETESQKKPQAHEHDVCKCNPNSNNSVVAANYKMSNNDDNCVEFSSQRMNKCSKNTGTQNRTEYCNENDQKLTKQVSGVNGYVQYSHAENGITAPACQQKYINLESEICKDLIPDELTESSYSGSTVATEESMVSSLCDDKTCAETCAESGCTENLTCPSSTSLCDNFSRFLNLDADASSDSSRDIRDGIEYVAYDNEKQMPDIMRLITKDLSEPYSIYTYRYFIHNWPKLCFLSMDGSKCIGAIVCKLDMHKKMVRRGYIAMLAIDSAYRRRKIGSNLVLKAIQAMVADDCDEVVLETEITNKAALHLYENLGFVRDKRLFHYYLNGVDALRLKLWLR